MTWRSKLPYSWNTPTLSPSGKMQMKMSCINENKEYTNKRKCASSCKPTLYRLPTAAKKQNMCKTK